jgi:hypothetical protein
MPGTMRGEMYEMPVEDALVILAALDDVAAELHATREELAELRAAARTIVHASALDIIRRYASKDVGLKVVK